MKHVAVGLAVTFELTLLGLAVLGLLGLVDYANPRGGYR